MSTSLKISIITVAYNSERTIEDTLQSVLNQSYENLEHIIVDGASTDSTLDIVKRFEPLYAGRLRWISKRDNGIYDAINKGIGLATGSVIGLLHSDDLFGDDNTLEKIAAEFEKTDCDGIYGNLTFVDPENIQRVKRVWVAGRGKFEWGWTIPHQTLYLKKEVYEKFGGYRTDMRNAADNEFILRVCKDGMHRLSYINDVLVIMKMGGASTKNWRSNWLGFQEVQRSLKMHGIKYRFIVNGLRLLSKVGQVLRAKRGYHH